VPQNDSSSLPPPTQRVGRVQKEKIVREFMMWVMGDGGQIKIYCRESEWERERHLKRARQERNNNVKNAFFSLQRSWNGRASRRSRTHKRIHTHTHTVVVPKSRARGHARVTGRTFNISDEDVFTTRLKNVNINRYIYTYTYMYKYNVFGKKKLYVHIFFSPFCFVFYNLPKLFQRVMILYIFFRSGNNGHRRQSG